SPLLFNLISYLRLASGNGVCSGRVEVYYNGEWGTVCDDDWDINDVAVVCRQVGCGRAVSVHSSAHFGAGSGPIHLDDVACFGYESSITDCRRLGINDCSHGEDAGVVYGLNISLINGDGFCSGRVEVYYKGRWGTVCDDGWDIKDAEVVCRQMGCGRALHAHNKAYFGKGTGPIHLDDVGCSGNESSISECFKDGFGEHNCGHDEDAGVSCSERNKIRLVNGTRSCCGRVEIYHKDQWGTVCDDDWDIQDAEVVCRQMGCGKAVSASHNTSFGWESRPTWLNHVGCRGTESYITDCSHERMRNMNCGHRRDAGVVCSSKYVACSKYSLGVHC
uniref:SRCR domain-containing protein n=1 Tax=Astyanax mexicanus TaxID=7994 RepID=A0A3B1K6T4_ASTMX